MKVKEFYQGKKVLITGHTGFKGSWLALSLLCAGAKVSGISLEQYETESSYHLLGVSKEVESFLHDIRDREEVDKIMKSVKPDIVFHLAAQPIVRESYRNPVETYEVNVLGTVNLLEAVRNSNTVQSVVNITTDKVYLNNEWCYGYRECDPLDGYDPYSNSKSCSELVTETYRRCFLEEKGIPISTARAGNVIGGGDRAKDRIIPDCIRKVKIGEKIQIRNPNSIRPYQHVLEPLYAYTLLAQKQWENPILQGSYNIGPEVSECISTEKLVQIFCDTWGENAKYEIIKEEGIVPHEANFLRLDNSKIKNVLGITPKWNASMAIQKVVEFEKCVFDSYQYRIIGEKQIIEYWDTLL